jgi:hypothetical protein
LTHNLNRRDVGGISLKKCLVALGTHLPKFLVADAALLTDRRIFFGILCASLTEVFSYSAQSGLFGCALLDLLLSKQALRSEHKHQEDNN